jgi:predicted nucleic acid-binding protein
LRYLLDTSVLTRLSKPDIRAAVAELVTGEHRLVRSHLTDLEMGFSARNGKEWDKIRRTIELFPNVEPASADYTRAGQVQRALAEAGLRGRKVPDLLIAAAAERTGLTILHYDHDFGHIVGITGQPHQWIVRAGAVD